MLAECDLLKFFGDYSGPMIFSFFVVETTGVSASAIGQIVDQLHGFWSGSKVVMDNI